MERKSSNENECRWIMMNATAIASNTSCVIMNPSEGHLLMSIYIIAFILGLLFNLATIGPIFQQICRKNILGIYLFCLSISDLLYILTMPLWIYYFSKNHKWNLGSELCSLVGFFYYSNLYISIFLLCWISIDRCLAITFPLRIQAFRRQRYAWIICGLVYVCVMSLHSLLLYLNKHSDPLDDQKRCYETFPMTKRIAMFNLIRVGIGFLLPLVIITVCYCLIPTKVQQSRGVDEQGKRKVRLLSMGVVGIFSVCFAPYHILLMLRSIAFFAVGDQKSCIFEQRMYIPFTCSLALSSMNGVVDPVLYVLASNGVRDEMKIFQDLNLTTRTSPPPAVYKSKCMAEEQKDSIHKTIMMNATAIASNTSCVIMNPSEGHLLMSIYIIAFILGLLFNLATIGPIFQQICRKNILGIYLFCLSISDLLYILTMPLWIYYFSKNHKWNLGSELCSLVGFFYYSNLYISIFLLCWISIDRCLAITFPLRIQAFRRQRYAWIICGLVYVCVMSLHSLLLYLNKHSDPLDDQKRCYETFPMTKRIAMFNLIRVGIGFLLPLVIITVCYCLIPTKVQQSRGVDEQGKRKVRLLSMGVVGIFSVCFAPYHILLMLRSIAFFAVGDQKSCIFEQRMYIPFTCSLALSSMNGVVDPVLYVLASNGVRDEIKFFCWKSKQRNTTGSPLVDSRLMTRVKHLS
ncbi:hypothetical protein DNTS_025797 [Danionella cerebrum]|uniref:G-protein coupled receptors family 1 profile domain-containing protein n=1 Tax=Danionella cerebrum TaxID=2873325 RepID=A0A553Q9R6_9TELE|nr:hypothetical protein DNTS_025797 [Danionella translucida]